MYDPLIDKTNFDQTPFNQLPFNHMDTDHHPAPTEEDKARLATALDKIFPNKLKSEHNTMTVLTAKEQLDEAVEKSAQSAAALIKEDGWAILRELYKLTAQALNATAVVIVPATQNREIILAKVSDPEGFSRDIQTTITDVEEMIRTLQVLGGQHLDKTGFPSTPEDVALISQLSLGYSQIQHHVETAVQPLLMALITTMQEAGVDTVSFVPKG